VNAIGGKPFPGLQSLLYGDAGICKPAGLDFPSVHPFGFSLITQPKNLSVSSAENSAEVGTLIPVLPPISGVGVFHEALAAIPYKHFH